MINCDYFVDECNPVRELAQYVIITHIIFLFMFLKDYYIQAEKSTDLESKKPNKQPHPEEVHSVFKVEI